MEQETDKSGKWKLWAIGCGCLLLIFIALPLLLPFYQASRSDHYEDNSSYNGHFICPKGKLLQLFSSFRRLSREDRFAFVLNSPNAGVSSTFEDVAMVSVIVRGEHADLAVFNHQSLNDGQKVPADILPLLERYETALISFGCRKGEVTLGTQRTGR